MKTVETVGKAVSFSWVVSSPFLRHFRLWSERTLVNCHIANGLYQSVSISIHSAT